ncbi:MAG: FAD-dependent oxidoreductase, partial [Verrucomicrobiota bacterium]
MAAQNPLCHIAIIGAGPSGLAAAWALRNAPVSVTVFEKSRGFGGRAASRTRHGARIDPGANYFKLNDPEVEDLIQNHLPTDELTSFSGEIWTFDKQLRVSHGDPDQDQEPKWTYRTGISTLGKLLASRLRANVHRETRIHSLEKTRDDRWTLHSDA